LNRDDLNKRLLGFAKADPGEEGSPKEKEEKADLWTLIEETISRFVEVEAQGEAPHVTFVGSGVSIPVYWDATEKVLHVTCRGQDCTYDLEECVDDEESVDLTKFPMEAFQGLFDTLIDYEILEAYKKVVKEGKVEREKEARGRAMGKAPCRFALRRAHSSSAERKRAHSMDVRDQRGI